MHPSWYGLDHEPINSTEAGRLLADGGLRVIATNIVGHLYISTMFLVMDHGGPNDDKPMLYQTRVVPVRDHSDSLVDFTRLYPTRDEALAGHQKIVAGLARQLEQHRHQPDNEDDNQDRYEDVLKAHADALGTDEH